MPEFREILQRNRIKAYFIAGLVLLAAPLGLFIAASAGDEPACWVLLGVVGATQMAVINLK